MGTFAIGTTIINAAEVTAIEQDGDDVIVHLQGTACRLDNVTAGVVQEAYFNATEPEPEPENNNPPAAA